jgi:hypothetical protein
VLRVEFNKCVRKGRYSVRRPIEKYGRKANIMKWKEQLNGDLMKQVILALATSSIISGGYSLTMSAPAQGASCRSEYDLCRRVRADPVRTRPNPAMIGSCEARYAASAADGRLEKSIWWGSAVLPLTQAASVGRARLAQALFCRRRHQPRRPTLAKIRPGSPAPAMGPGTVAKV